MRLVHVIPHVDQEAAGPSYSVPRLCQSLAACNNEVELTCIAAQGSVEGVDVDLHPEWPVFCRFAVSTSLVRALSSKAKVVDIVHNHSLWSMVNIATGWVVPSQRAKLVTSPRGTLSAYALSRSRWIKGMVWPLQRRALVKADMLHATSEIEYQQIRTQGFSAPIVVLPNGIDLPVLPTNLRTKCVDTRTLLYLGRIHPIKGLDRLLETWASLQNRYPEWRLVLAGRGEASHVKEIKGIAEKLGLQRVEFVGPLYGAAKSMAYFKADLFVLPTHSENFGMVVAESLAHACPAVVSRGAPWAGLESHKCGWWVDNDVDTLADALGIAMGLSPDELIDMGLRGRAWMENDFGWNVIGKRMDAAYRWLLKGGDRPEWVRDAND